MYKTWNRTFRLVLVHNVWETSTAPCVHLDTIHIFFILLVCFPLNLLSEAVSIHSCWNQTKANGWYVLNFLLVSVMTVQGSWSQPPSMQSLFFFYRKPSLQSKPKKMVVNPLKLDEDLIIFLWCVNAENQISHNKRQACAQAGNTKTTIIF